MTFWRYRYIHNSCDCPYTSCESCSLNTPCQVTCWFNRVRRTTISSFNRGFSLLQIENLCGSLGFNGTSQLGAACKPFRIGKLRNTGKLQHHWLIYTVDYATVEGRSLYLHWFPIIHWRKSQMLPRYVPLGCFILIILYSNPDTFCKAL